MSMVCASVVLLALAACAGEALSNQSAGLRDSSDPALQSIFNGSAISPENLRVFRRFAIGPAVIQRRKNDERSTSSSSGTKKKSSDSKGDVTLGLTDETDESNNDVKDKPKKRKPNKRHYPKSTVERHGWRKWHRKCTRCPDDDKLKWRDQRIKWICGAYQRARRSFKSLCMMYLRNCQDGTMFTKIHDHRCKDDRGSASQPHGEHLFYDYRVVLSGETGSTRSSQEIKSDSSESEGI